MKKVLLVFALVLATSFISCETETEESYDVQATEKDCGSSPGEKDCDDN